jgi:amino acid transporter
VQPDTESSPDAEVFFMGYLAAPIILALYIGWKVKTRDWRMWIPAHEIDLTTNVRMHIPGEDDHKTVERTWKNLPKRIVTALF